MQNKTILHKEDIAALRDLTWCMDVVGSNGKDKI